MRASITPFIAAIGVAVGSGAACEKTTSEHRLDGPIRLAMGDCGKPSTKYVSGHKPEPFQLDDLKKSKVGSPHRSFRTSGRAAPRVSGSTAKPDFGRDGAGADERPDTGPRMSIGKGVARGGLALETIRATIESRSKRLLGCYRAGLREDAELAGTVVATFTINKRGKVKDASAAGVSSTVSRCVRKTVESVRFEKPDGERVKARFAIKFSPGVAAEPSPAPAPATTGDDAPAKPAGSEPSPAGTDGPGLATVARAGADQARAGALVVLDNPPGYQPGSGNPLRDYRSELIECFRTKVPKKRPYGSLVVDLVKYQGAYAAVAVTSDNGNDTLEECVKNVIGKASDALATSAGELERCPLAFGSVPLEQADGIDITEDRVLTGRRMRAMVADVAAQAPETALAGLRSWAEKLAKKRTRVAHRAVVSEQPVVVRPISSTSVQVVRRVLEAVSQAGLDPVLAVSRAGVWERVHGFALPVAPVPRGSGQGWTMDRHAGKHREGGVPKVYASMLIGTHDVWIGVSRIDDFRQFTTRGQELDLAVFERGLRDVKRMKYFANRRDLEIAAADQVSYETLVTFIDFATAAGFTEWTLMAPEQLSAKPPR